MAGFFLPEREAYGMVILYNTVSYRHQHVLSYTADYLLDVDDMAPKKSIKWNARAFAASPST